MEQDIYMKIIINNAEVMLKNIDNGNNAVKMIRNKANIIVDIFGEHSSHIDEMSLSEIISMKAASVASLSQSILDGSDYYRIQLTNEVWSLIANLATYMQDSLGVNEFGKEGLPLNEFIQSLSLVKDRIVQDIIEKGIDNV